MNTHQFHTQTDQRWYAGFVAGICLAGSIAAAIGMWLWLRTSAPALFVLIIGVCMTLVMGLILMRQRPAELHFEDDTLYLRLPNGQEYTVYDVPAQDYICMQSSFERRYDVGRIKIKDTVFYFYGVQQYADTCRYIQETFPSQ